MTATTTSIRPRRSPRPSLIWIVPVLLAVAASVFVLNLAVRAGASPGGPEPGRGLRDAERPRCTGGWLGLGTVDRTPVPSSIRGGPGGIWHFRLTLGPDRIGRIVRTQAQLEQSNWRIAIPKDAADQLRERRSQ
jgi:hypothetical protein